MIRWSSVAAHDFCLDGNTLYYIDMRQGSQIYAMSIDGVDYGLILGKRLLSIEKSYDGLVATLENGESYNFNIGSENWFKESARWLRFRNRSLLGSPKCRPQGKNI